jgi:hypothetical protein
LKVNRQNLRPENAKINDPILRGDQTVGIKTYLPITSPTRWAGASVNCKNVCLAKGETLTQISKQHGVSVQDIQQLEQD